MTERPRPSVGVRAPRANLRRPTPRSPLPHTTAQPRARRACRLDTVTSSGVDRIGKLGQSPARAYGLSDGLPPAFGVSPPTRAALPADGADASRRPRVLEWAA